MPRGAKVKTTWQKKQPRAKAKGKKAMNFTIRGSEGALNKRKGEALRSPGEVKLPHSSFRNVMGKPRDYDHPLEEILFSKDKKDKRSPHERLVEFQQECKHSFSRVLAQKRDDQGKVIQLISCGNCWVAKWSG